jgi:hypothetical protein
VGIYNMRLLSIGFLALHSATLVFVNTGFFHNADCPPSTTSTWNVLPQELLLVLDRPIGHVGGEPTRGDCIDLDVVWRPFTGKVFGETYNCTFACMVRGCLKDFCRSAAKPGYRGDIDDFS